MRIVHRPRCRGSAQSGLAQNIIADTRSAQGRLWTTRSGQRCLGGGPTSAGSNSLSPGPVVELVPSTGRVATMDSQSSPPERRPGSSRLRIESPVPVPARLDLLRGDRIESAPHRVRVGLLPGFLPEPGWCGQLEGRGALARLMWIAVVLRA